MQIRVCDRCKKPVDIGYIVSLGLVNSDACVFGSSVNINGIYRSSRAEYDLCPLCLKHYIEEINVDEE